MPEKRNLIGRRSLVLLILKLIAAFLGFVGLYLITNYLGAAAYGSIAFSLALLAALNAFADLGFNQAHIKKVSEGQDLQDCISSFIVIKLALTGLLVAVVAISLLIWIYLLGGSISGEEESLIVLFTLYYIFLDLASIASVTFSAKLEIAKSSMIALVEVFVRIPLILIVALGGGGAIQIALTYVVAGIFTALVALLQILRERVKWRRPTLLRTYAKFAMPLALVTVLATISSHIDKIVIGYFDSNLAVAYYASSQAFLNVIAVVGVSVATLTFPTFSDWHAKGQMRSIVLSTQMAERYLSMFGTPITVLLMLFPSQIAVALFGSEFAPAGEPLRWLSLSMFLVLINVVHVSQINAVNRPDITAKLTFLQFFIFVPLLLILVPASFFGFPGLGLSYKGAAIASVISATVMLLATRYVVNSLTGTAFNPRLLRHLLAAIAVAVVLFLLGLLVPIGNIVVLFLYALLALELFALFLYTLRELTAEDFRYFQDVFNPSKLWKYTYDEVKNKGNK